MQLEAAVVNKLACPSCQSPVVLGNQGSLQCEKCSKAYATDRVVDFLVDKSKRSALEDADYDSTAGYNDDVIDRIAEQWLTVFENADVDPTDKNILEIGAGTGALTIALLRGTGAKHVFATDISDQFLQKTLERAQDDSRLTTVRCDCNQLPVQDSEFDLIVGRSILHHLLDYELVLSQCSRILGKGGKAIFFEPVLEGKLVIAMYIAMIVDLARQDGDSELTEQELTKMESLVRHITKSSWYPQTRESLAKIEDKYIFSLPGMRESGEKSGFSKTEFVQDNRTVDQSLWSNLIATIRLVNIDVGKLEKYRILSSGYARTFGQYGEFSNPPMGYFCFTK